MRLSISTPFEVSVTSTLPPPTSIRTASPTEMSIFRETARCTSRASSSSADHVHLDAGLAVDEFKKLVPVLRFAERARADGYRVLHTPLVDGVMGTA